MKTTRNIPAATRRIVITRDGLVCIYCLATDNLSIDHVIAFSIGGSHDASNLVVCCMPCNRVKGARPLRTFLIILGARGLDVDVIAERIFRAIG